jgi:hypothetical protein
MGAQSAGQHCMEDVAQANSTWSSKGNNSNLSDLPLRQKKKRQFPCKLHWNSQILIAV